MYCIYVSKKPKVVLNDIKTCSHKIPQKRTITVFSSKSESLEESSSGYGYFLTQQSTFL